MSPLRARMIEDMRIRGMAETSQKAHIRALKDFTAFLGRSPDTATSDELRAYQLHMTDTEVTPSGYNSRITALGAVRLTSPSIRIHLMNFSMRSLKSATR